MKKIIIIITCFIGLSGAFAQQREIFHNPVIEADVPDPSMIRVGNYYYLVSTTMHLMPGCPVMRSKDLVHWETISYVFQRLTDLPRYDLKEGTVYGRGQWASSIRYHDGRFYVWFSPNDEPHRGYIYTAEDPAGEWTLVSRPPHHHDASLFFDDDGKVYLFYGTGQPPLFSFRQRRDQQEQPTEYPTGRQHFFLQRKQQQQHAQRQCSSRPPYGMET